MRQKLRPKHQVLILKCYPRYQKNTTEVKPNSSELSYLLYYASTRRSKLQKVGSYLERKNLSDVRNNRIGNVQVTLAILKSLIEKCPRDLSLYGGAVLRILNTVLRSHDITMVEASVPTFEVYCAKQDPAFLAADQGYLKQYEQVIRLYVAFASKEYRIQGKAKSVPLAVRFRRIGLEAIKSLTMSESLSAETERQLALVIPVILEAVYSSRGSDLLAIEQNEHEREECEKEQAFRRRQSVSTVQTSEISEHDPVARTTEESDKFAEQSVLIAALQALRQVFSVNNRSQVRQATTIVLQFVTECISLEGHFPTSESFAVYAGSWPTILFQMMCQWTPVQDRFLIIVTAVETLIRCPIEEKKMERQCLLSIIIACLLGSNTNFIGLSVMDVLVGLIQHSLLVLQQGGNDSIRTRLLNQLQTCISNLATHVYYSDQISDMTRAILARLKPSSDPIATVAAIEDPEMAANGIVSAGSLVEKPSTDGFFSFETARELALNSIRNILEVANQRALETQSKANRSPVDISVWEGTQWLLRDPHWEVRKAYVDAFLTWANLELKKDDLKVLEESPRPKKDAKDNINHRQSSLAKRAVSNASQRERCHTTKSPFLQRLHLAVYENAHQYAQSESDILLLHLLLATLVRTLGVNSTQCGLPMIVRLQEDIQDFDDPTSKVHIGALVHGYFWALSVQFDFDASSTGREIHNEISRRMKVGLWLYGLTIPPRPLSSLPSPEGTEKLSADIVEEEALKPFDNRQGVVDRIADAYSIAVNSPPSSPPRSPNRSFSTPFVQVTSPSVPSISRSPHALPNKCREQMLSDWSKEACMEAASSRSDSFTGSGFGTASTRRHLLAVHAQNGVDSVSPPNPETAGHSPQRAAFHYPSYRSRPASSGVGLGSRGPGCHVGRASRATSNTGTPVSASSRRSTVRVEDLKRVLSS
ncbi:hypothetical protein P152DRAFT_388840, partial [Eremomyces bilateralis CBS 781.70]